MAERRARWFAGSILGAVGVGTLLGLAYFSQTFSLRFSVAVVAAVAVYFAFAIVVFTMFRSGLFRILAVAGGLGGLVFSLVFRSPLPWSIFLGCVIGLAVPYLYLLTNMIFHSAGETESE